MNTITINPTFTDPLVPPPSLASINEFFNNFSSVTSYDLSLYVYESFLKQIKKTNNNLFNNNTIGIKSIIKEYIELGINEKRIYELNNNNFGRCYIKNNEFYPQSNLTKSLDIFSKSRTAKILKEFFNQNSNSFEKADIIAITASYDSQILSLLYISKVLKKEYPKIRIIIGGVAVSWLSDYISNLEISNTIDFFFTGDLPKFDKDIEQSFINIITKNTNKLINRHLLSINGTLHNTDGSGYLFLPLNRYWGHIPLLSLTISRGCYYSNCSFCSYGFIKENKYESETTINAFNKLKTHTELLKINVFNLESDCIRINEIEDISDKIIKEKLNVKWHISLRFENRLDYNVLQKLYNAGCRRLYFGFESASKQILKKMKKGINLTTVQRILSDCKSIGIGVEIGVIYGFPGETKEDAKKTYEFLKKNYDLIHRCDTSYFHLETNSEIEKKPNDFDVEIIGRSTNYNTFLWKDKNNYEHSKHYYSLTNDLFIKKHILEITEDILLVNLFGVNNVEKTIRNL